MAAPTVGDRSNLTKAFALILAATVGWPALGLPSLGRGPSSTKAYSEIRVSAPGAPNHTLELKSVTERHRSVINGFLDDDSALVCDDTEDWVEVCASLELEYQAVPAPGPVSIPLVPLRTISPCFSSHSAPIQCLCRYQC